MQHIYTWGAFKSMFAQNSQFLTPSLLTCSSLFVLHVLLLQDTLALVSYELSPLSKKFRDDYEFSNKKSGSEKREKN